MKIKGRNSPKQYQCRMCGAHYSASQINIISDKNGTRYYCDVHIGVGT